MQKKFAVIDCRAVVEIEESLKRFGYQVIRMPPWNDLSEPISAHPDMLLTVFKNNIYCHKNYFSVAMDIFRLFEKEGYTVKIDSHEISSVYPKDISYNSSIVGNNIFALLKHMSPNLYSDCSHMAANTINVRQGYTKCSSAVLGDAGVISSDASIIKAAESNGIKALRITEGHVYLPPYSHGFIGGATGYDDKKMFFAGNYLMHPDGKKIESFCHEFGAEPISLTDSTLMDIGTILFI